MTTETQATRGDETSKKKRVTSGLRSESLRDKEYKEHNRLVVVKTVIALKTYQGRERIRVISRFGRLAAHAAAATDG